MSRRRRAFASELAPLLPALLAIAACSQVRPVDGVADLRREMAARLDTTLAAELVVPFELNDEIRRELDRGRSRTWSERRQVEAILELVFDELGLRYDRTPTRDAVGTYAAGAGNCLSFVNLFVGLAREAGLPALYVEVEDYQRWSYEEGTVLSRGHIVAGLVLDGRLSTYDFLPYRPKAYRSLTPIDDRTAAAHFYNNLGAEALLAGDAATAERHVLVARALAPDFEKAINNLGIVYLRRGEAERAVTLLRQGAEKHPESVPLLTNLSRGLQRIGQAEEAREILDRLARMRQQSPFFYLYRAMEALAAGDTATALDHLREAERLEPDLPEVHLALAKVRQARGERPQALLHVRRALDLDPSNEEARDLAARLASP
jgi:Flp pilus assembly protein TadD